MKVQFAWKNACARNMLPATHTSAVGKMIKASGGGAAGEMREVF